MAQPICILQLSDLHFGPHSRFSGVDPTKLGKQFATAMTTACVELGWKDGLRYCIATGDIAEAARPREYETALVFFKSLLGELGIPEPRCLFVPGNHDVSWAATQKVVIDQGEEGFSDTEREQRIAKVKFQRFEEFLAKFYGKSREKLAGVTSLGHGAYVYQFLEDQLSIATLNTCEQESHLRQGGLLGKEQAQALMNHWQLADCKTLLKVVALHHNPVATVPQAIAETKEWVRNKLPTLRPDDIDHLLSDLAGFEGLEFLKRIASDCQVQLILHGHYHASDRNAWPFGGGSAAGQTHVLSAGSGGLGPGKLPKDEPTVAQLLSIDPGKKKVHAVLRVYEPRARPDGSVEAGTFAVDAAKPKGDTLALSLPVGFAKAATKGGPKGNAHAKASGRLHEFEAALRDRLLSKYHRWELSGIGAIQPGGASRPIEVQLDDIYLSLRVAEGYDPNKQDRGAVLDADSLLARNAPLVLRGVAGSGKTTWMRWIFRRLLERPSVMPFMIELRKLAALWERTDARGHTRTLDDYLQCWVAESGVSGWQDQLVPLLSSKSGPRPVLLVDGWDELGPLGTELREKLLAFLKAYPRILVVVSSRPYGESRPSDSDHFEVLDLQPLSDTDIAAFSQKFHRLVHGLDDVAARSADEAFHRALYGAPDALALARTPLLLTMMLLISRDRPLPDKRHRLYEICIESLLSARPAHRESEGAQLGREQYRPDDSATRLRVVSSLAYQVQTSGYENHGRGSIVRTWEHLVGLLPADWTVDQRHGFLAWLVGGAGLLTDRADGSLNFAHLSFQEFLCARYLDTTTEGEGRLAIGRTYKDNHNWWETLRLWAALVNDREPSKLDPVLETLSQSGGSAGFWLVGAMLADGVGTTGWAAWKNQIHDHFHFKDSRYWPFTEQAWLVSRQEARRKELTDAWPQILTHMHWLSALWAERWLREYRPSTAAAAVKPFMFKGPMISAASVAQSRTLFTLSPTWPCEPLDLVLLRVLPGRRITLGNQIQIMLSLGASLGEIQVLARLLLERIYNASLKDRTGIDVLERKVAYVLKQYFEHNTAWNVVLGFAQDFVQDLASCVVLNFGIGSVHASEWDLILELSEEFARMFIRNFAQDFVRFFERDIAEEFARGSSLELVNEFNRYLMRTFSPYLVLDFTVNLAETMGMNREPAWLEDWRVLELAASTGRSTLRTLLAHSRPKSFLMECFHVASQASLGSPGASKRLQETLRAYPADGCLLWPALARHIARCSTDTDRELLISAIKNPEQYEPPLSWGLQYYWRGDLLLSDGSELTLDALCDELKLPHLPYLEDYPPHIEIPREKPTKG